MTSWIELGKTSWGSGLIYFKVDGDWGQYNDMIVPEHHMVPDDINLNHPMKTKCLQYLIIKL